MTFTVFHEFPVWENGLPKFQDFPGPAVTRLTNPSTFLGLPGKWCCSN